MSHTQEQHSGAAGPTGECPLSLRLPTRCHGAAARRGRAGGRGRSFVSDAPTSPGGHPTWGPVHSVLHTVTTSFLPNCFREDGKNVYFCVCHTDRPEVTGEQCVECDRGPRSGGTDSEGVVTGGPGDRCVSPLLHSALINHENSVWTLGGPAPCGGPG